MAIREYCDLCGEPIGKYEKINYVVSKRFMFLLTLTEKQCTVHDGCVKKLFKAVEENDDGID